MNKLNEQCYKVIEVTRDHYTLENGDVYEHTFNIDDNISVERFQQMLDNAKQMMLDTIKNIEKEA